MVEQDAHDPVFNTKEMVQDSLGDKEQVPGSEEKIFNRRAQRNAKLELRVKEANKLID